VECGARQDAEGREDNIRVGNITGM